MKRSLQVAAPILAAAALSIASIGCRRPEMQRCVDENNKVVDPSFCKNLPNNQQPNNSGYRPGGGGIVPLILPYRYYYGGGGSSAIGSPVFGGSSAPLAGHSYSTTRGGFGSSFSSHSSEGGGEGAHGSSAGE